MQPSCQAQVSLFMKHDTIVVIELQCSLDGLVSTSIDLFVI